VPFPTYTPGCAPSRTSLGVPLSSLPGCMHRQKHSCRCPSLPIPLGVPPLVPPWVCPSPPSLVVCTARSTAAGALPYLYPWVYPLSYLPGCAPLLPPWLYAPPEAQLQVPFPDLYPWVCPLSYLPGCALLMTPGVRPHMLHLVCHLHTSLDPHLQAYAAQYHKEVTELLRRLPE